MAFLTAGGIEPGIYPESPTVMEKKYYKGHVVLD